MRVGGEAVRVISQFMLLFITAVPNTKLCAWGEEDSGGHVYVCVYFCSTYYKGSTQGGGIWL